MHIDYKWGHPWFYFKNALMLFFTETKLRYIYTRLGYPSVTKLYNLLNKAGYNIDIGAFKIINKFYHHYQIKK